MAKEVWKEIPGFPDYQASTEGRIRSMKGETPRILRVHETKDHYCIVSLSQYHSSYTRLVHILVANTFLKKPGGNRYHIVHLNGNRNDNRLVNLEWSTGRRTQSGKKVYAYDDAWEFAMAYGNATEAAIALGGSAGSIRNVCCGIGNSYLGFRWSYLPPEEREDYEANRDYEDSGRAVYQYAGRTNYETWVATWDNYLIAGETLGISPDAILRCCRGTQKRAGGYAWDFADRYLNEDDLE